MDFELPEDVRMIREVVARFTAEELVPLEQQVIRREAERGFTDMPLIAPDKEARLRERSREIGLWGIDVPAEFGGQDLGALHKCVVVEQLQHSITPFVLPPESPNLHWLKSCCSPAQVEKYLLPYVRGEMKSCLALTEPGAGSDAAAISMRAVPRKGGFVLNGEKIWISNARQADFMIVVAVTDIAKGRRGGMTAFLVDRDTPGVTIPTVFPMVGERAPYAVSFENVELDAGQVLGEIGHAFTPLQKRLGIRRLEIAARCLGLAARCIDLMIEQARSRTTFGERLGDRQTVQFWIADSFQELEMCRLATYRLAWRIDQGAADVRRDAAMVKVQATEMIQRVVDRAIQLHGGMGVSKELPLEYIYRVTRLYRIVEGASEVHRWTIGRDLIRDGQPEYMQ